MVTAVSWAKVSCRTNSSFSPSPSFFSLGFAITPVVWTVGSAGIPDFLSLCFCRNFTSSNTNLCHHHQQQQLNREREWEQWKSVEFGEWGIENDELERNPRWEFWREGKGREGKIPPFFFVFGFDGFLFFFICFEGSLSEILLLRLLLLLLVRQLFFVNHYVWSNGKPSPQALGNLRLKGLIKNRDHEGFDFWPTVTLTEYANQDPPPN